MTGPVWPPATPGTWLLRLPNWIGDAIMALPALRALPRRDLHWIGVAHPRVLDLYRATGWFDELHAAAGFTAPVTVPLRLMRRPDRAIVFTRALTGALLARWSRSPLRLGRATGWGDSLLTHPLGRAGRDRPLWEDYLELALAAGGRAPERPDFTLDPGPEATARAAELLQDVAGSPVALAPGATYGPAKQWPVESFLELARRLRERGWSTITVGGASESGAGRRLAEAGALDLTGQTSLREAIAVLARARVLVTNDSGALHLGRAAGTRVVAVFGSSSPLWTGPGPEEGTALWLGLPCSPCFRRRCPLEGEEVLRCLRDLPVETVLAATAEVPA